MNLIFRTLNKPAAKNKYDKMLHDGFENTLQKSLRQEIYKVIEQLNGVEIVFTLDYATSKLSTSDIPDDKAEIIQNILNKIAP